MRPAGNVDRRIGCVDYGVAARAAGKFHGLGSGVIKLQIASHAAWVRHASAAEVEYRVASTERFAAKIHDHWAGVGSHNKSAVAAEREAIDAIAPSADVHGRASADAQVSILPGGQSYILTSVVAATGD